MPSYLRPESLSIGQNPIVLPITSVCLICLALALVQLDWGKVDDDWEMPYVVQRIAQCVLDR